jgi:Ni,Fe-hydrogenase III large subunit/Ni,Fe-hydrogenase III component G
MIHGPQLISHLKEKFENRIIQCEMKRPGQIFITIQPQILTSLTDYLFNELNARFVVNVGSDETFLHDHFTVSYIFSFDKEKLFVIIKVNIHPNNPFIDSVTPIIPGANWTERETRDAIGVHPKNHPDPRRLILADDWPDDVYPLRKSFPYNRKPPSHPENRIKMNSPPEGARVVPIGPFFPVLEEPAYFKLFVEGEKIVGCDYRGFYNHRGIEKVGESALTYNKICFIAERICGICGFVHSSCYCEAVEQAAGIEAPLRAKYIRTIMLELERIHSHLLWLGIAGHIIGFDTFLMQSWRIREPVMWLCELISGNRKTYGMNLIGGVRRDIPKEIHSKIFETIDTIEKELKALVNAVIDDISLHARLKNVAVLTHDNAVKNCAVGPTARASGVNIDARTDHPCTAYDKLQFRVIVKQEGDCWARTLVRLEELFEAIHIVRHALRKMPAGKIMADAIEIEPGREGVCSIEAPRGEATHYVLTGDDNRPYRWRVKAPTYPNLQSIPDMIQDEEIADVPIAIGSIDPCFSCTERMIVINSQTGTDYMNVQDLFRLSREKTEKIRRKYAQTEQSC